MALSSHAAVALSNHAATSGIAAACCCSSTSSSAAALAHGRSQFISFLLNPRKPG